MAPNEVVALLDFCNGAVQINWRKDPTKRTIRMDHRKTYNRFPAVKLTRFGVVYQFELGDRETFKQTRKGD